MTNSLGAVGLSYVNQLVSCNKKLSVSRDSALRPKGKWGYLREDSDDALKAGIDKETGLHRTGLEEYLQVIFPNVHDWVHDKGLPKDENPEKCKIRPDYRSKSQKLIVEFDGLPHFQYPAVIADLKNTRYYQYIGYRVVRIPYFIQLTKDAVKKYFGVDVTIDLFDIRYPSLTGSGKWMPSHICSLGLMRMALEFLRFPDQYQVNKDSMIKSTSYTDVKNLDSLYMSFKQQYRTGITNPEKLLSIVLDGKLGFYGKDDSK